MHAFAAAAALLCSRHSIFSSSSLTFIYSISRCNAMQCNATRMSDFNGWMDQTYVDPYTCSLYPSSYSSTGSYSCTGKCHSLCTPVLCTNISTTLSLCTIYALCIGMYLLEYQRVILPSDTHRTFPLLPSRFLPTRLR